MNRAPIYVGYTENRHRDQGAPRPKQPFVFNQGSRTRAAMAWPNPRKCFLFHV